MRSSVSYLKFQYLLVFLRSSSSCLLIIPRLPVLSIFLFIFRSITYFRRHFRRNISQIYSASLRFVVCNMFLSPLTPGNTSCCSHDGPYWSLLAFLAVCIYLFIFYVFNVAHSNLELWCHMARSSWKPWNFELVLKVSINNHHHALDYITSLFNMQAPTCFGSSLPSSESFLDPCELHESRTNKI
jgi:hypothetical protein